MLLMKAAQSENLNREGTDRLWDMADDSFDSAISSTTDSQSMLCEWGSMLFKYARRGTDSMFSSLINGNQSLLIRAAEKFQIANAISTLTDVDVLVEWAQTLCSLAWNFKTSEGHEHLTSLRVTGVDNQNLVTVSDKLFSKAATILERVLSQQENDKENKKNTYLPFESMLSEVFTKQQETMGMFLRIAVWGENLNTLIKKRLLDCTTLNLANSRDKITKQGWSLALQSNTNLKVIILSRCEIVTEEAVFEISKFQKNIEYLDISYCTKINSAESIMKMAGHCTKLKSLIVVGCRFSDVDLVNIAKANAKKFERFELSNSTAYDQIKQTFGKQFAVFVKPQLTFDLKSILQNGEDVLLQETDFSSDSSMPASPATKPENRK